MPTPAIPRRRADDVTASRPESAKYRAAHDMALTPRMLFDINPTPPKRQGELFDRDMKASFRRRRRRNITNTT